ncbi:Hydrolase, alpha/beta fold family functionally coupled to Phosphoribulokinase [Minicystis rosea]|nr:Hydrolase, alpha/beta fold family functionally coupled to Phosphoribulokinase [Minicystis rosea]
MIMRTFVPAAAAAFLAISCAASEQTAMTTTPPPPAQTAAPVGPEAIARAFVEDLAAGRTAAAEKRFNDKMRGALPDAKLAEVWSAMIAETGPFQAIERATIEDAGALHRVHVITRFAGLRQSLDVIVDEKSEITGFWRGPVSEDLEIRGRELVEKLSRGDIDGATAHFDTTMRSALPAPKLTAVWSALTTQAGAFEGIEGIQVSGERGHWNALVTCRFAKTKLVAKVVFNVKAEVAGLFFVPPESVAAWQPASYVRADAFTERAVNVGNAPALPGTLTLPKGAGPFPVVVLVHGSGPQDADESLGGAKVFKDLAWGLGSRGIATLRYVKRTRHSPAGVETVKQEILDAARAAVELCRGTAELDPKRVVVIGHSEGAEWAPKIAVENPSVAAIVMLAAPSRPLQDLVLDQFTYFAKLAPDDTEAKKKVTEAQAFKKRLDDPGLKPDDEVSFPGGAGTLKGTYLLSLRGYDPTKVAAGLSIPILLLQGDRDYQVTAPDLARFQHALGKKPNVTIKQYPALNHLFIAGKGTPGPSEYQLPGHVDEQVIGDIATFVGKLAK